MSNRNRVVLRLGLIVALGLWAGCQGDLGNGGGGDAGGVVGGDDGGGGKPGDDAGGGKPGDDGGGGGPQMDGGPPPQANHAPVIFSTPRTSAVEAVTYRYAVEAEDTDGDALTFSLPAAPMGMAIDAATGLLAWTPPARSAGKAAVTVRVTDASGASTDQPFEITVGRGQAAPRFTSTPPLVAMPGSTWTYTAGVADPDDPSQTWSVVGPNGMTVDMSGKVTWQVPQNAAGSFPVTLTATDGTGNKATQSFSLGVPAPGDKTPPVVAITTPASKAAISAPTDVIGTATHAALAGYHLELCRTWGGNDCTPVADGAAPVMAGKLGRLDPRAVPDGTWELRLTAQSAAGITAQTSVSVVIKGVGKVGVMRLVFPEFRVKTNFGQLALNRVYDGLDRSLGPIGNGWRYEWDVGHAERPKPLQTGWKIVYQNFPPKFLADQLYEHPINFTLADGRTFQFIAVLECDGALSSIHAVRPKFIELSRLGGTVRALDAGLRPYSDTSYDLYLDEPDVYTDLGFFNLFEPAYYELTTTYGEVFTFSAKTGQVVKLDDGKGAVIDRTSGTSVKMNGVELIKFQNAGDGLVGTATDALSGAQVQYTRDGNKDLTKVVTVDGQVQTFTYAPGSRLTGYDAPGLAPEVFEYDEQGRVISHSDGNGTVNTIYDDANHKVTVVDVAGNALVTQYDDAGHVLSTTDPLGHTTSFTWLPGKDLQATKTDPLGKVWKFGYDAKDRRNVVENPLGEQTKIAYDDPSGTVTTVTDGAGRVFGHRLDAKKRIDGYVLPDGTVARSFSYPDPYTLVSTDALGRSVTTKFDSRGRTIAKTDPVGRTTTTAYDDAAHTATFTDPDGTVSKADLDKRGRFAKLRMGSGGTIEYRYGASPLPDQVVRPDGAMIEYKKNGGGKVTQVVVDGKAVQDVRYNALGQVASVRGPGGAVSYRYDAAGHLTRATDDSGAARDFVYDAAGNLIQIAAGNGTVHNFIRDDAGRPVAFDDGAGRRYEVTYDKSGKPASAVDKNGYRVDVTYDANGRVGKVAHPGGLSMSWTYVPSDDLQEAPIASETTIEGITWSYAYDPSGEVSQITDGSGNVTKYERTAGGAVSRITDALGRKTSFSWSTPGPTQVVTPEGRTEAFTYDASGRRATWTRTDGSEVKYAYGPGTVDLTLPGGGGTYRVQDDAARGVTVESGAPGGAVSTWRDEHGRPAFVQLDDGGSVEIGWNGDGKIASLVATTPGGAKFRTGYAYDTTGQLSGIRDPDGGLTTYRYDGSNRLIEVARPNGTRTTYTYGPTIRPTKIEHWSGNTLESTYAYTYDTAGRVASATTPEGAFQYEYDKLGHLAVERTVNGQQVVAETKRTWDAAGNLLSLVDGSGTTTYAYDKDDRLLSSSGPAGKTTYTYSGRGALESIQAPGGTTTFTWDAVDRLTSVATPDGKRTSYKYDVSGRRVSVTDESGERRCVPLPVTPLGWDDCAVTYAIGGAEKPQAPVFGPAGLASLHGAAARYAMAAHERSIVRLTDDKGKVVGSAAYDAWGRRAARAGEDGGYGYTSERQDPAGLVFLRARWYHPESGRFLTPDRRFFDDHDPRGLHRYAYVFGNPLNSTDPSGYQTIAELNVATSINQILNTIVDLIIVCVKQELQAEIFNAIATWATNQIRDALEAAILDAAGLFGGGFAGGERDWSLRIGTMLCQGLGGLYTSAFGDRGLWDFEYIIDDCGAPRFRGSGYSSLADCIRSFTYTHNGIDIVFAEKLGIELKLDSSTAGSDQTARYCRFGARQGLHVFVYAYLRFPDDNFHREKAELCWHCWSRGPAVSGNNCQAGVIGSIYVGLGALKNNDDHRFYLPSSKTLCNK